MSTLEATTFQERLLQANRFKNRFPNSVPVVSLKDSHCTLPPSIHNQLFIVPNSLRASEFTSLIRKKINLSKIQSLMLFINNKILITADTTIAELYSKHSSPDGFLYILCTDHEAFGMFL